MNTSLCPVAHGFAHAILPLLPLTDDDAALQLGTVECFGQAVPRDIELARARYAIEYAAKTCLPRAFEMFSLPHGQVVLATLPALSADSVAVYIAAMQDLAARDWVTDFAGGTLMRDSLVRPLQAVLTTLTMVESRQVAEVCATLESLIERLSGSEELVPVLTTLLLITPDYPDGRPARPATMVNGLSFS
jgi:hypothetical protein